MSYLCPRVFTFSGVSTTRPNTCLLPESLVLPRLCFPFMSICSLLTFCNTVWSDMIILNDFLGNIYVHILSMCMQYQSTRMHSNNPRRYHCCFNHLKYQNVLQYWFMDINLIIENFMRKILFINDNLFEMCLFHPLLPYAIID